MTGEIHKITKVFIHSFKQYSFIWHIWNFWNVRHRRVQKYHLGIGIVCHHLYFIIKFPLRRKIFISCDLIWKKSIVDLYLFQFVQSFFRAWNTMSFFVNSLNGTSVERNHSIYVSSGKCYETLRMREQGLYHRVPLLFFVIGCGRSQLCSNEASGKCY